MNAERKRPSNCAAVADQLCSVNVSNELLSKFVNGNFRFGIAFTVCIICPFSFIKNSRKA